MKTLLFILIPFISFSQKIPKHTNTIKIHDVTFQEVANKLLDAGYTFDKIDSNYKTVKTDFKDGTGKNKNMKIRLMLRIKDSSAIITGEWYGTSFIGNKLFGQEQTAENSTFRIENTWGANKNSFDEMKAFAESFNKPVEYLKQ